VVVHRLEGTTFQTAIKPNFCKGIWVYDHDFLNEEIKGMELKVNQKPIRRFENGSSKAKNYITAYQTSKGKSDCSRFLDSALRCVLLCQ